MTIKHGDFNIIINEDGLILTDINLLKAIRKIRSQLSMNLNIAPFCICSNKVLVRLATVKPEKVEEFMKIKGIGKIWCEKYYRYFVEEILNYKN